MRVSALTRRLLLPATLAMLLPACGGAEVPPVSACVGDAVLSAELYGDVRTALDWRNPRIECDGMPRPFGNGARLRFAGPATVDGGESRLAFIVALPDLEPGATARELPATVTLMEEDSGRFYSNRETEICWSDIETQELMEGGQREYAIGGIVYCVAPLAELNGTGSVTIRDLRFRGRVDWREDT